jgi:hypothetical protein
LPSGVLAMVLNAMIYNHPAECAKVWSQAGYR